MPRYISKATLAATLLLALPAPSPSLADDPHDLAGLDTQFVCPEALQEDDTRTRAVRDFFEAYARIEPRATVADALLYRRSLLTKHGCVQTLRSLDAADVAVESGKDVLAQAWLPIGSSTVATLLMSTDHLRPFLDPRAASEKAVSAYMELRFPQPVETNVTHTRYDTVVSHAIYYCVTGRYALVENDYFLEQKQTLHDPSPSTTVAGIKVYDVTPAPSGSFNALALRWACGSSTGAAT